MKIRKPNFVSFEEKNGYSNFTIITSIKKNFSSSFENSIKLRPTLRFFFSFIKLPFPPKGQSPRKLLELMLFYS